MRHVPPHAPAHARPHAPPPTSQPDARAPAVGAEALQVRPTDLDVTNEAELDLIDPAQSDGAARAAGDAVGLDVFCSDELDGANPSHASRAAVPGHAWPASAGRSIDYSHRLSLTSAAVPRPSRRSQAGNDAGSGQSSFPQPAGLDSAAGRSAIATGAETLGDTPAGDSFAEFSHSDTPYELRGESKPAGPEAAMVAASANGDASEAEPEAYEASFAESASEANFDDDDPHPAAASEAAGSGFAIVQKPARGVGTGSWWTIPLICLGLGLIAACLLLPAAEENRRAAYELAKINRDVDYFERQSVVNQDFLTRISNDPTLAERLAQRQLRLKRQDTRVIKTQPTGGPFDMSPSSLVAVDPPAPMPAYSSPVSLLSRCCDTPRKQVYFLGLGLFAVAAGLVLGGGRPAVAVGRAVANHDGAKEEQGGHEGGA